METNFLQLVEKVAAGEEIIIVRAGTAVARMVPFEPVSRPKKLGLLQGRIEIADGFDDAWR